MCGRYYIDETLFREIDELLDALGRGEARERIGENRSNAEGMADVCRGRTDMLCGDIHPGDMAPVLVRTMDGIRLVRQSWGLPVPQEYGKGLIFNARAESVLEKPMFRDGVRRRRAVIPARGFYEWNRAREKVTFSQEGDAPMYLAGFFNQYEEGSRFVILTTEANAWMKDTHDRMPLLLERREVAEWLEAGEEFAVPERLLKKVPGELKKRAEYEQISLF